MIEGRKNKHKILIVDDDPEITKTFSLVLEDSGLYKVDSYNDPLIALQNFESNFYDLLLLDIRMPNMNGFELYDKIEKIDNKVKVCFVSAYDVEDKVLRKQFPSLEVKYYLPKPVSIKVLMRKLE
jgi:two-component system, OmpR family, response regulator ChvI